MVLQHHSIPKQTEEGTFDMPNVTITRFKPTVSRKENLKEYNRQHYEEWRKKNKEECLLATKVYRDRMKIENHEKYMEMMRKNDAKRYAKNREKRLFDTKISKEKRRILDIEAVRAKAREHARKQRSTSIGKLSSNLRCRLSCAIKNAKLSKCLGSAVRDLGCTVEELKLHIETQFVDGMSWDTYGGWHVDHIKPLSAFDLSQRDQIVLACHYSNLQPLWALDNLRKGGVRRTDKEIVHGCL
jgi:hypothetical protein